MVVCMNRVFDSGRRLRGALLVVSAAIALSGCGDQEAASPTSTLPERPGAQPSAAVAAPLAARPDAPAALPSRPNGSGWSRLTSFGAETDSVCIGNGRNATCAVETYLACIARRDNPLCAIAQNVPKLTVQFEPSDKRRIFDYRFRRLGPFTRRDLPADLDVDWKPVPGDLLAIVDVVECTLDGTWQCRAFTGPHGHFVYVKRAGGLWYVKDSHEPPS